MNDFEYFLKQIKKNPIFYLAILAIIIVVIFYILPMFTRVVSEGMENMDDMYKNAQEKINEDEDDSEDDDVEGFSSKKMRMRQKMANKKKMSKQRKHMDRRSNIQKIRRRQMENAKNVWKMAKK